MMLQESNLGIKATNFIKVVFTVSTARINKWPCSWKLFDPKDHNDNVFIERL